MGNGASELDASSPLGKVSERLQSGDATLTKVDFTGYGIGDAGVERLAPLLFSASVKAVLLQSNNVGSAGADALARALVAAPSAASLAHLHLGRNGVTDAGAIALCRSLVAAARRTCRPTMRRRLCHRRALNGGLRLL